MGCLKAQHQTRQGTGTDRVPWELLTVSWFPADPAVPDCLQDQLLWVAQERFEGLVSPSQPAVPALLFGKTSFPKWQEPQNFFRR